MKKITFFSLAAVVLLNLSYAKPYTIDNAHSSVNFEAKHLSLSKVNGSFDQFEGKVDIDPKTKKINVLEGVIKISSINTKNQKREDHLKSADFFDATKFPDGKFVMTKQDGDKVYGNLTLHGVTKPVIFGVKVSGPGINPLSKQEFMAVEIEGKINRKDFDIGKSTNDLIVSDLIGVNIQLEVYAK